MGLEHVIGLGLFIYFQKGHSGPSRGLLTWRLFRNFRPLNINHWGQDSKLSIHLYGLFKIGIPRTYSDNTQYIGSPYQFTCVSSVNWGNWAVPCFWECKTYKTGLWIPQKTPVISSWQRNICMTCLRLTRRFLLFADELHCFLFSRHVVCALLDQCPVMKIRKPTQWYLGYLGWFHCSILFIFQPYLEWWSQLTIILFQ